MGKQQKIKEHAEKLDRTNEKSRFQLQKLSSDLKERIKELECLYSISRFVDRQKIPVGKLYSEVLDQVCAAFKDPDNTGAEITIQNANYRTANFLPTKWKLYRPIMIARKEIGKITTCYLGAFEGKTPFLKEEKLLLTAVAKHLGTVSEHLEMETHIKNSEKFYRSLFENANDGILLHYPNGRIVMANRAAGKMTGYAVRQLSKMNLKWFLSSKKQKTKNRGTTKHPTLRYEMKMKTKSGDIRIVEVMDNELTNVEKEILIQKIIRDITVEKQRIDSMRVYTGQVIQAQERERKRIARDLHDETIQALLSLGMDIDALMKTEQVLPDPILARLGELRNRTRNIRDGIKSLTRALRPPMLEEVGLISSLRWLATEVTKQRGVDTKFEVHGDTRRLSPDVELTIFRIAQEALNNMVKHSKATSAVVKIQFDPEKVKLIVSDNGVGFDLTKGDELYGNYGKTGLIGMNERARLLNGTLKFDSSPEHGTVITLEAPLQ